MFSCIFTHKLIHEYIWSNSAVKTSPGNIASFSAITKQLISCLGAYDTVYGSWFGSFSLPVKEIKSRKNFKHGTGSSGEISNTANRSHQTSSWRKAFIGSEKTQVCCREKRLSVNQKGDPGNQTRIPLSRAMGFEFLKTFHPPT